MENQDQILDSDILNKEADLETEYIISVNKFILLSLSTFGLYEIWWFYKAWRFFRQKDELDIMPAARALFAIFFINSLFNRILIYANEKSYYADFSPVALT